MESKRIKAVIIDDEKEICDLIVELLNRDGHEVSQYSSAESFLKAVENSSLSDTHLFIIDWMLPGISGLELIKKIRSLDGFQTQGVLMLTARTDPDEIIQALDAGVDDYVTKPFEARILVARLNALLRRMELSDPKQSRAIFRIKSLKVDQDAHQAFCGNEKLKLTPYEFKLLLALVEHQGKVLTREKLIHIIQGTGVKVIDRAVDTHIFWLRKKLGTCSNLIETVRGVGYRVAV